MVEYIQYLLKCDIYNEWLYFTLKVTIALYDCFSPIQYYLYLEYYYLFLYSLTLPQVYARTCDKCSTTFILKQIVIYIQIPVPTKLNKQFKPK